MLFKINEIGLFQENKKDVIKFNSEINFISGASNKGKSSIGEIIDYCLGSSKQTVPAGKIINEVDVFSINLSINNHDILIARNRYNSENFEGSKYIFLQKIKNNFSLNNIEIEFFQDNSSSYLTTSDFIELEIPKYFSSFPPKTRLDGKEMVRPTIRNMPTFMFQVQDTIKNKNHLFYQMDKGTKVRGIKRDFELFLGLVDFSIYNKINRKNQIIKELKKIDNNISVFKKELEKEFFNLKSSYHRLYTHLNIAIDIEAIDDEDLLNIFNIDNLQLEYNIDSNIGVGIETLQTRIDKQSRIVEDLKIEHTNIFHQIKHLDTANIKLQVNTKIDYPKQCPICDSLVNREIEIFEKAKQKIQKEKDFLTHFNSDILREKEVEVKKSLSNEKKILKGLIESVNKLKNDTKEVKTLQKKEQLLYEIKGMIKNNISTIKGYKNQLLSDKDKEKLELELEKLEEELRKINIKKKTQEAELLIGNYATEMLNALPFDKTDYEEPNLKFDIKDVSAYQQTKDNIYYLSDIGSAENHLSFHLSVFLGLHKYILKHTQSILPSFVFLDQPSQVYFPKEEDFQNKTTGDIKEVEDIYKSIINFVEKANNESMFSKIQIIIVDHFYSEEEWYQKYLVEPRWEKGTNLALIKD